MIPRIVTANHGLAAWLQIHQQCAGACVVGRLEPFGETAVHLGEQLARLPRAMLISPQTGETGRCA
jgi:hypothetical protein